MQGGPGRARGLPEWRSLWHQPPHQTGDRQRGHGGHLVVAKGPWGMEEYLAEVRDG